MISLNNVGHDYGSVSALNDISLNIESGSITAILGENGAGKTTLFGILLGRLKASRGKTKIFDDYPGTPPVKERVSAMLQHAALHENLTVEEHLSLYRSYHKAPMKMDEIIHKAGIAEITSRRFDSLSGGQKQRVLFALAIAGDPELLILDEPTVAMDIISRESFWQTLREFQQ